MRFLFKTSYEQDIRLAKHGGHLFWYALLGLVRAASQSPARAAKARAVISSTAPSPPMRA